MQGQGGRSGNAATGIPPGLIIEVVSPSDRRIRDVDERIKPKLYARIGVEEYLLVESAADRRQ